MTQPDQGYDNLAENPDPTMEPAPAHQGIYINTNQEGPTGSDFNQPPHQPSPKAVEEPFPTAFEHNFTSNDWRANQPNTENEDTSPQRNSNKSPPPSSAEEEKLSLSERIQRIIQQNDNPRKYSINL